MINKGLLKYYQSQYKTIKHNLPVARDRFDMEAIHKIRVAIKKIRALFCIIEAVATDEFHAKTAFSTVKPLFKAAGKVRDIQVQQSLLNTYEQIHQTRYIELRHYFDELQEVPKPALKTKLNEFDIDELEKINNTIDSLLQHLTPEEIITRLTATIYKYLLKIHKLKKDKDNDEVFHDVRTYLKQVLYMMTIMNKYTLVAEYAPFSLTKVEATAELLGNWHDKLLLTEYIKEFKHSKYNQPFSTEKYIHLQTAINRDTKYALSRALNRLEH